MPHRQKTTIKNPRKEAKASKEDKASKNLVLLKLSEQERRFLERITKATSKNAADIVREALNVWMAKRQRLCLDS